MIVLAQANRTDTRKSVPYRANYQRVASGSTASHILEIRDGTLWTWGNNSSGQLGDGTTTHKNTPAQIGLSNTWVTVAAGSEHSLALKADGSLWAWGRNSDGQLGDGTVTSRTTPVQIGTDTKWVSIAAGSSHSIGLKSDGSLWAWGRNSSGQVGDGTATKRTSPAHIGTGSNWLSIATGSDHTMGLRSDGSIWAWGGNAFGQLGDGTTTNRTTPVQIGSDTKWVSIACGGIHTFGLKSDGTLWAWGSNFGGQLGDGSTINKTSPVQVGIDNKWVSVAPGSGHSLGLKSDGTLWGWGKNLNGELGNGTGTNTTSPIQIGSDNKWVSLSAGFIHSLGLKADGTLFAWGIAPGAPGQNLISATANNIQSTPLQVSIVLSVWLCIDAGDEYNLGVKTDGTLWAWGRNSNGQLGTTDSVTSLHKKLPVQIGTGNTWVSVAAGRNHSLALKADGTLWSWGSNSSGKLGDAITIIRGTPAQVGTDHNWVSIAADTGHSLALKSDGTMWAFGNNTFGQIGNGTNANRPVPTKIGNNNNWVSIQAGAGHSLGLQSNGTLWSWGRNSDGQLGDGTTNSRNTPGQVGTGAWKGVSAGRKHTYGLKPEGKIFSWGDNTAGSLGDGTATGTKLTPGEISSGSNPWVMSIAGTFHGFGIRSGEIWGWGLNSAGQLGDATTLSRVSPQKIGFENNWISVTAGAQHSIGLKADRNGFCATGDNAFGQLGDNTNFDETVFVGYLDPFSLIATNSIDLQSNSYVQSGGAGVTSSSGTIELSANSTIIGPTTFAIAKNINAAVDTSISTKTPIPAPVWLPDFKSNPYHNSGSNVTVANNSSVTLNDTMYKNLNIGANATVTFTKPLVYIRKLSTHSNATIEFSNCTELMIYDKMEIGSGNQFNMGMEGAIVYAGGKVDIDKGSSIIATVYSLDKIETSGTVGDRIQMKGLFIADEIESKNTTWNVDRNFTCALNKQRPPQVSTSRQAFNPGLLVTSEPEFDVFPNPNTGRFSVRLNSALEGPLKVSVIDYLGREVYYESMPDFRGSTFMEIDLTNVASSYYIVRVEMAGRILHKKVIVAK
jgi:alpha-tubulin suppressor-like RCC1 family protein